MIASLLSPSAPPAGRISQLLPAVKCSSCLQPVPLDELGDHTCAPVPAVPKAPANTALLPERLQGRVANPSLPPAPAPPRQEPQHQRGQSSSSTARLRINTRGNKSPTQPSFQPKSSPLARSEDARQDTSSPRPRDPPFPPNPSSSPLRTRMRTPSNAGSTHSTPSTARPPSSFNQESTPAQTRSSPPRDAPFPTSPMRGPSQSISVPMRGPTPTGPQQQPRNGPPPPPMNAPPPMNNVRGPPPGGHPGPPTGPPTMNLPPRPGLPPAPAAPGMGMMGPRNMGPGGMRPPHANTAPPPPPQEIPASRPEEAFVPPAERGIDTKSGGAAGMAGVGRRGFAAAARAAMFVGPNGPQPPYNRKPNAPQFLDIDAASRSTETPPLSAGSGYSSHSPGPTSPLPQSEFSSQPGPGAKIQRTPSPSGPFISTPTPALPTKPSITMPTSNTPIQDSFNMSLSSPISARLPFFEKYKNNLPGMSPSAENPPAGPSDMNRNDINNSTSSSSNGYPATRPRADTATSRSGSSRGLAYSGSSNSNKSMGMGRQQQPARAPSPESESEYGGLAYADSTDYEDNDHDDGLSSRSRSIKRKDSNAPPPLPNSILRNGSTASSRMQFGSVSGRSNRSLSRHSERDRDDRAGIRIGTSTAGGGEHSRENSISSSYSSVSSAGDAARLARTRSNSSAIAQALGLSQTPPSDYKKLGGPGVGGMQMPRVGRSISGGSTYSRGSSEKGMSRDGATPVPGMPMMGRQDSQRSIGSGMSAELYRTETTSSKASAALTRGGREEDEGVLEGISGGAKTQRSNTVQGVQSPDTRPIKLPTRSLTSPQLQSDKDKALVLDANGARVKKERARRPKSCLRCSKAIEDGRWVSVDGGGVLCEKCWKNMYLPKCRRCTLPIEKQAVSSSDGQLKGKYHKECFNCHTCHKPFPDRTFYVYDGKPLCAYHYHEANDSLCAAARCGQPIEGPCAVSHTGDRYHPEHMTCEYQGYPECRERLDEYWEVDGRMLCERHAGTASRGASGSDEEEEERDGRWGAKSSRAMKRVTRFIDLTGAGGLGLPPSAAAGGERNSVQDSDLR